MLACLFAPLGARLESQQRQLDHQPATATESKRYGGAERGNEPALGTAPLKAGVASEVEDDAPKMSAHRAGGRSELHERIIAHAQKFWVAGAGASPSPPTSEPDFDAPDDEDHSIRQTPTCPFEEPDFPTLDTFHPAVPPFSSCHGIDWPAQGLQVDPKNEPPKERQPIGSVGIVISFCTKWLGEWLFDLLDELKQRGSKSVEIYVANKCRSLVKKTPTAPVASAIAAAT